MNITPLGYYVGVLALDVLKDCGAFISKVKQSERK
jgi:hypothetical protein